MSRDLKLSIGGASGEAQKALEEAAAASELAAKAADHLADEFKKAKREAESLDRQLAETTIAASALAKEFAKTNDTGIKKQLDAQRKAAGELKKLRSDVIGDTEKDAKAAAVFAEKAAKALKDAGKAAEDTITKVGDLGEGFKGLSSLTEALPAIGAGAAIPGLALLGGALGAGAGVGAVGAGIGGAIAGNPDAFKAAWGSAINQIKVEWIDASKPFIGPTLDAIKSVGPIVAGWNLSETLGKAASYERPLVAGITAFVSGVEHGVAQLIEHAGPEVQALSAGLGRLGDAADSAFTDIAQGAHGGALALHDAITATSLLVEGFGKVTLAAEDAYAYVHDHPIQAAIVTGGASAGASILSNLFGNDDMTSKLTDVSAAAQAAAGSFGTLDQQSARAASELERMNQAFDRTLSDALGLSEANVQVAQGFADLTTEFEKGAGALDLNNQKGRDNITVIDGIVSNLQRQRDEQIAAAGGTQAATDAANRAYDSQLSRLGDMLTKLTGNKSAVDKLLDAFRD
ncbi:MAG: hypothetical protein EPN91_07865, partial [Salinibacterium sp.]